MKSLRLKIELVPANAWGRNLRKQIRRGAWDKLRAEVFAKAGQKCEICGRDGKLNCHEAWEYDDKKKVQRLTALEAICQMCHHATHYGMSQILARQGLINLAKVDRHFLRVNGATPAILKQHKQEAYALFLRRSQIKWAIDFGKWHALWEQERAIRKTK